MKKFVKKDNYLFEYRWERVNRNLMKVLHFSRVAQYIHFLEKIFLPFWILSPEELYENKKFWNYQKNRFLNVFWWILPGYEQSLEKVRFLTFPHCKSPKNTVQNCEFDRVYPRRFLRFWRFLKMTRFHLFCNWKIFSVTKQMK